MDIHEVISVLALFVLVTTGAFVLLCWITSYVRFESMAKQLELDHRAMDPHDAFQLAISKALGTAHRAPDPFCLFVARAGDSDEQTRAAADILRQAVRKEDEVYVLSKQRIGLLVRAPRRHAENIGRRLAGVIASAPGGHRFVAGVSSCPENGERVLDLLSAAEAALEKASEPSGSGLLLATPSAPVSPSDVTSESPTDTKYVDPLTGLLRPEHIETAVPKYLAARRRRGLPVSFLLIDVDHLDRYNNHYGREAGDAILHTIGGLIEKTFRETDLTARLGGDEFLVAVGCKPTDALKAAQRLVAVIKRSVITTGRDTLRVTVKVGVAGYPDHGGHPRFLLEKADLALSVARERGGNTCVLYEPSVRSPTHKRHQDRF